MDGVHTFKRFETGGFPTHTQQDQQVCVYVCVCVCVKTRPQAVRDLQCERKNTLVDESEPSHPRRTSRRRQRGRDTAQREPQRRVCDANIFTINMFSPKMHLQTAVKGRRTADETLMRLHLIERTISGRVMSVITQSQTESRNWPISTESDLKHRISWK